jgi:hypothetical protein
MIFAAPASRAPAMAARHDAAPEQTRGGRRGRRIDLGALSGRHQRQLGEGADAERGSQLGAVGERHLPGGVVGGEAVPRTAAGAGPALAADRPPVEDHEVAGRHVGDALAHRLDQAGRLVAEQEREVVVDAALAIMQVGVADPAGLHLHQRLARPRVGDVHRLHRHRRALRPRDHTANLVSHATPLLVVPPFRHRPAGAAPECVAALVCIVEAHDRRRKTPAGIRTGARNTR